MNLTNEQKLGFLLSINSVVEYNRDRLLELAQDPSIQWDVLLKQSRKHKIFHLMYDSLNSLDLVDNCPIDVRVTLQNISEVISICNTYLLESFETVAKELNMHIEKLLILKGLDLLVNYNKKRSPTNDGRHRHID